MDARAQCAIVVLLPLHRGLPIHRHHRHGKHAGADDACASESAKARRLCSSDRAQGLCCLCRCLDMSGEAVRVQCDDRRETSLEEGDQVKDAQCLQYRYRIEYAAEPRTRLLRRRLQWLLFPSSHSRCSSTSCEACQKNK